MSERKYYRMSLDQNVVQIPLSSVQALVNFVRERTLALPGQKFYVKYAEESDHILITQYEPRA